MLGLSAAAPDEAKTTANVNTRKSRGNLLMRRTSVLVLMLEETAGTTIAGYPPVVKTESGWNCVSGFCFNPCRGHRPERWGRIAEPVKRGNGGANVFGNVT